MACRAPAVALLLWFIDKSGLAGIARWARVGEGLRGHGERRNCNWPRREHGWTRNFTVEPLAARYASTPFPSRSFNRFDHEQQRTTTNKSVKAERTLERSRSIRSYSCVSSLFVSAC